MLNIKNLLFRKKKLIKIAFIQIIILAYIYVYYFV